MAHTMSMSSSAPNTLAQTAYSPAGEAKLTAVFKNLREDLDPKQQHSPLKLGAVLKHLGLTPEDIEPDFVNRGLEIDPRVPAEKGAHIKEERKHIWDGLRQSRLKAVYQTLETVTPDDARRLLRVDEDGVRACRPDDIPPVDSIGGMDEFNALMEKKLARAKADQKRKATKIATDLLNEKKRMEEADARLAEQEQRLQEYRKERNSAIQAARAESEKKAERRKAGAARAAEEREEYENKVEEELQNKLMAARAKRAQYYSKEGLQSKLEAAQRKREKSFQEAINLEEKMLAELNEKRQFLEERLMRRREEKAAEIEARQEARPRNVEIKLQEWAENKSKEHDKFMTNFNQVREEGRSLLKQKAKSCGDITKKAHDKWRSNFNRLREERNSANDDLMARHEAARVRAEERAAMKLKCDNDVFSFCAVKHGTWGELVKKRQDENRKSRDAQTQALVFRIGEQNAKMAAQRAAKLDLEKKRQGIAGEMLKLQDSGGIHEKPKRGRQEENDGGDE